MLTSLPTIPDSEVLTYKYVYQQAVVAPQDFTSGTTSQNITMLGIPANWVVVGCKIQPLIAFVGASLSSVTVQIGSSGVTNAYGAAFELTTSVSATTFQVSSPFSAATSVAHDVIARFISTGASINAISAGMVEITLQVRKV